jgi:Rrf2 family protein
MLCISSKGRFATRILVLLASGDPDRVHSKAEIAALEGLTTGYVQQLMGNLQAAGLVISHRGKQGGFKLARAPQSITVAEALRVMEGEIHLAPCHDGQNCDKIPDCPTRSTWIEAASILEGFFEETTIAQLASHDGRPGRSSDHAGYAKRG